MPKKDNCKVAAYGKERGGNEQVLAIDLKVTDPGLVSCCSSILSSFFTMCSSLLCLSGVHYFDAHIHLASDVA